MIVRSSLAMLPFIHISLAFAPLGLSRPSLCTSTRHACGAPSFRRVPAYLTSMVAAAPVSSGSSASTVVKPWATTAQETVDYTKIEAMFVRHILLQSTELATLVFEQIKAGADFSELAASISSCEGTKSKGGEVGWVSPSDSHLDEILGIEARTALMAYKPGDVFMVTTERGIHLIKVVDVMTRLTTKSRKRGRLPGKGQTHVAFPSGEGTEPRAYWIETMGCQMNKADSERMEGALQDLGLKSALKKEDANVFVLNTCTIRDHAEQKVYAALGPYAARKHRGEDVAIVVAGCVAQQEGEMLIRRIPEVDLVMGPQYANRMGDLLEDVMNGNQVVATDPTLIMEDISKPRRASDICAWVNIIWGCNENCSYCVVPGVRGVEQSRPRESIRAEIEELAANGYREVTLLGQNIDAYGRDMVPKQTFADLLHYLSDIKGIERIRYVTSHPRYMSERVVSAVADLDVLCKCYYVPFQSGDDTVLKRMRRGYTQESYMKIIDRIKRLAPDAAICGDVIVGFPGETDEQFQHTLDLMNLVKFDNLNTFAYSPRPNTEAALWPDQVPEDVKSDRLQQVQRLGAVHALERSERYMGRLVDVLVEEINPKNSLQVMGRNSQNRPVFFEGVLSELRGKIVPVRVTGVRPWSLSGVQEGEPR